MQGLWNLFLMEEGVYHSGLTVLEYAVMSEVSRPALAPDHHPSMQTHGWIPG